IIQGVRRISELDGIPGSGTLKTREADLTPFFASLEEVSEGAVKTFEGRIDNDGRQIRMSLFPMTLILLIQMHVFARLFVVSYQLFQTGIVHLARCNQGLHQGLLLCLVGSHSILICPHRKSITESDYIVKRQGLKPQTPNHGRLNDVACGGLKPFNVNTAPDPVIEEQALYQALHFSTGLYLLWFLQTL